MEAHDRVLSRLGAGHEKDLDFAKSVATLRLLQRDELLRRPQDVVCTDENRGLIEALIRALFT